MSITEYFHVGHLNALVPVCEQVFSLLGKNETKGNTTPRSHHTQCSFRFFYHTTQANIFGTSDTGDGVTDQTYQPDPFLLSEEEFC